jgi:hypothetical protein
MADETAGVPATGAGIVLDKDGFIVDYLDVDTMKHAIEGCGLTGERAVSMLVVLLRHGAESRAEALRGAREPWDRLRAEVEATEAWYGDKSGVNAWVGWDRLSGWYGGAAVDGEPYTEEVPQVEGHSPDETAGLIADALREYRERIDREREEERDA